MALEEGDEPILEDCLKKVLRILVEVRQFEIKCFLSEEDDSLDIFLEIHAGAGGTESQDWAEMLRRMYLKWFDKKNFRYEMISEHKGEEAGIKSSTLKITGENLYGLMKKESGVHRLVRISPFDSGARRHTSFASVWVYPCVDDNIDIVIDENDQILSQRYEKLSNLCNLSYHSFIADSVDVKKHDKRAEKYIHHSMLQKSNYYKNMILKLSEVDKIIKTIQQPADE